MALSLPQRYSIVAVLVEHCQSIYLSIYLSVKRIYIASLQGRAGLLNRQTRQRLRGCKASRGPIVVKGRP